MLDYKAPTSITELRSCLGLFSYSRRFIKDFAAIAAPMHALTKQERKWSDDHCAEINGKVRQLRRLNDSVRNIVLCEEEARELPSEMDFDKGNDHLTNCESIQEFLSVRHGIAVCDHALVGFA